MLLCVGGSGAMRTGLNLVLNFRAMGLYHMLILALERDVCTSLWDALPSLACVWWPRRLEAPRPASLYNTMFNKVALAFFEARKVLLERLVVKHRLNVLHLDADTIWFANPYPVLKTVYRDSCSTDEVLFKGSPTRTPSLRQCTATTPSSFRPTTPSPTPASCGLRERLSKKCITESECPT